MLWIPYKYCLSSVWMLLQLFIDGLLCRFLSSISVYSQILNLVYWYLFPLNTCQMWSEPLSSFPQNIKGSWLNTGISILIFFLIAYDTYLHNTLFKCATTKFIMSKINIRYFHPLPLYSSGHPKKENWQAYWLPHYSATHNAITSMNPKYFLSLIDTYLHPF